MPRDDELKESLKELKELKEYVDVVRQVEQANELFPTLSAVLSDRAGQDLAYAMRIYGVDGKHVTSSRSYTYTMRDGVEVTRTRRQRSCE